MILNKLIGSEDGGKEIKTVLKHKWDYKKDDYSVEVGGWHLC